jgi:UDP-glucose 4-epimerase
MEEVARWGLTAWHAADITFDALANINDEVDAIVHCAGSGSVAYSLTHPFQDFQRSCMSIAAALEYARLRAPEAKVIYLSSAAIYGDQGDRPIVESVAPAPVSPYGFNKLQGEVLCEMYGRYYGIRSAVLRLFSVYGCGLRKQLLWDACGKAARHEVDFSGTGMERRDWLHVSDAAELVFRAVEWATPARCVLNGGTGEAPTVREILAVLFGMFDGAPQPRFSGKERPGDPRAYCADINAAQSRGWRPSVRWEDGVRRYAEWYRSLAA